MNSINNLLLICFICILMHSCDSSTHSQETNSEHWSSDIVLVDTFRNKLFLMDMHSFSSKTYATTYLGSIQDSIALVYCPEYVEGDLERSEIQIASFSSIEIYVDTSQTIGSIQKNSHRLPPPPGASPEQIEDYAKFRPHRGNVLSYPVFIKNTGLNRVLLGNTEFLPIFLEAKDSLGNWTTIQEPHKWRGCGMGLIYLYLDPQEILITACSRYAGDYLTKLRLAFHYDSREVYSNEFEGTINYGQFEADPNGLNLPERNFMFDK